MSLFTATDLLAVDKAVAAAEARSCGALVVAILPRSDAYAVPRATASLLSVLLLTLAAQLYALPANPAELLLAQVLTGSLAWWLIGRPALLRRLLRHEQAQRACQLRAYQLFASQGVHRTQQRSGVLLLISELERVAILLGDDGIDGYLGAEGWQERLDGLLTGLRMHCGKDALLRCIQDLGDVFAERYPRQPSDSSALAEEAAVN